MTEILDFGGLILQASCTAGDLALWAKSTTEDAVIAGGWIDNSGLGAPIRDGDFDPAAQEPLVLTDQGEGGGSFAYQPRTGPVVSVVYGFYEESGPGGDECWAAGTATPGS